MKRPLNTIAMVQGGYTVRNSTRDIPLQPYRMIQIRSITDDGVVDLDKLVEVELPEIDQRYLVKKGDVLLTARGTRRVAAVLTQELPDTLVGNQFFIITPDPAVLNPVYLAWYLNARPAQAHFEAKAMNSFVEMIKVGDVADLPISLPTLAVQQAIAELAVLARRERMLEQRLAQLRWMVTNGAITDLIEQASAPGASGVRT